MLYITWWYIFALHYTLLAELADLCPAVWFGRYTRLYSALLYAEKSQTCWKCWHHTCFVDSQCTILLAPNVLLQQNCVRVLWYADVLLSEWSKQSILFWGTQLCRFFQRTLDLCNFDVVYGRKTDLNLSKESSQKLSNDLRNSILDGYYFEYSYSTCDELQLQNKH